MRWSIGLGISTTALVSISLVSGDHLLEQTEIVHKHGTGPTNNVSTSNIWGQESLSKSHSLENGEDPVYRSCPDDDPIVLELPSVDNGEEDSEYVENDLDDQAGVFDKDDERETEPNTGHIDTILSRRTPPQSGRQQSESAPSTNTSPSSSLLSVPYQFPAPHIFRPPHHFQSELSLAPGINSFRALRFNSRLASSNSALERNTADRQLPKSDSASSIDGRRFRFQENPSQLEGSQSSEPLNSRVRRRDIVAAASFIKRDPAGYRNLKEQSSSSLVVPPWPSLVARGDHGTDPDTQPLSSIQETSPRRSPSSGRASHGLVPGSPLAAVSTGPVSHGGNAPEDTGASAFSTPTTQPSTPRSPGRRVSFNLPPSPGIDSPSPPGTPLRSKSGRISDSFPGMLPDGRTKHNNPKSPALSQATEQSPERLSPPRDRSRSPSTPTSSKRKSGRLLRRASPDVAFGDYLPISRRSLNGLALIQPRTPSGSGHGSAQGSASPTSSQAENELRQMSLDYSRAGSRAGSVSGPGSQTGSPDIQTLPPRLRPGVEHPPREPSRVYRAQSLPGQRQNFDTPARTQRSNTLQFLVDLARYAPNERDSSPSPPRSAPAEMPLSYYPRPPGLRPNPRPSPTPQFNGPRGTYRGSPRQYPAPSASRMSRIDERWPLPNPGARGGRYDEASDGRYHPQARLNIGPRPQAPQQQQRYVFRPARNGGNSQRSGSSTRANRLSLQDTANNRQRQNRLNPRPATPERQQTPSPTGSPRTPRLNRRDILPQPRSRSRSSSTSSPNTELPHSSSTSSLSSASSSRSGLSSQSSLSQAQSRSLGSVSALLAPTSNTLRRSGSRRALLPFAPMTNALRASANTRLSTPSNAHENVPLASQNREHTSTLPLSSLPPHPPTEQAAPTSPQRSWPRLGALTTIMRGITPPWPTFPQAHPQSHTESVTHNSEIPQPIRPLVDLRNRPIPGSRYDADAHDAIPIGQAVRPFQVRASGSSGIGRPAIPIGQAVRRAPFQRALFGMGFAPDHEDRQAWINSITQPLVQVGRSASAA